MTRALFPQEIGWNTGNSVRAPTLSIRAASVYSFTPSGPNGTGWRRLLV